MEELIKKIQAGDEMAFKKLVQNIENDLYRLAKTRLNDNDDIKDAIQNTMLITYKMREKSKIMMHLKLGCLEFLLMSVTRFIIKIRKVM